MSPLTSRDEPINFDYYLKTDKLLTEIEQNKGNIDPEIIIEHFIPLLSLNKNLNIMHLVWLPKFLELVIAIICALDAKVLMFIYKNEKGRQVINAAIFFSSFERKLVILMVNKIKSVFKEH